jgi:hypothetical protein
MKSHLLLLSVVLQDMEDRCCTSTSRDFKTITTRVQSEGLSFLTIALPDFCKDFQQSLSSGRVDSTRFKGYAKRGYLPKLFRGFTSQVFDPVTGLLADVPSHDAIYAIRQITLLFAKINLPCTHARVEGALDKYIGCEQEIRVSDARLSSPDKEDFVRVRHLVMGDLLNTVEKKIYDEGVIPKHGPGATADRLSGNRKYDQVEWTQRLEEWFPHGDYIFPSWRHFHPDTVILEPGAERPVRVITVPKTQKTPRIIAIEPTCMQYVQQGVMEVLVGSIQRNDFLRWIIGFDDQIPNQEMAREGSLERGNMATLDLSEASDRVSNQHVRLLCSYNRRLGDFIEAARSRKADVPGRGVIRLAKFASMGSALTFPMEAMIFTILIFMGIERELCRPLTKKDLKDLVGKVRVYGDDIIVPVEFVRSVVKTLHTFGYVVNLEKSFWTGRFRESCGKEFYDGTDVTSVRVREFLPTQRRHVPQIISTVSLRNQMYYAGNWKTAAFLDEWMKRLIPFPTVLPESEALGRHSFLPETSEDRFCRFLHKPLVRAYVVKTVLPRDPLEGHGALTKYFLRRGNQPVADGNHLERAGRPKAVNIKLGWVSPT